jgi:hypothetical protein
LRQGGVVVVAERRRSGPLELGGEAEHLGELRRGEHPDQLGTFGTRFATKKVRNSNQRTISIGL